MLNKCKYDSVALIALLSIVAISLSARVLVSFAGGGGIPCWDLRLRYDEIQCIQGGLDPYDIFLGKSVSDKYRGYPRCDVPQDPDESKLQVCTYPAWHTVYCYFYGWLPWSFMRVASLTINTCFLAFMVMFSLHRLSGAPMALRFCYVLCLLGIFSFPVTIGYLSGNYGFMMMFLSVAFAWSLERKYDLLAGLCWGLMMFKPQIGVLFVWPLVLSKRYKTIIVSVVFCLLGLFVATSLIGKNPIDLLLQIPNAVPPPAKGAGASLSGFGLLASVVHIPSSVLRMLVGGICCGVSCYLFKDAKSWYLRIIPVLLFIPIWNYAMPYDRVVLWLFVLYLFGKIFSEKQATVWQQVVVAIAFAWMAVSIICGSFDLCRFLKVQPFVPSGIFYILNANLYRLLLTATVILSVIRFRRLRRQ